jgi:hypothetical protein
MRHLKIECVAPPLWIRRSSFIRLPKYHSTVAPAKADAYPPLGYETTDWMDPSLRWGDSKRRIYCNTDMVEMAYFHVPCPNIVIESIAKQSRMPSGELDCRASFAMTKLGGGIATLVWLRRVSFISTPSSFFRLLCHSWPKVREFPLKKAEQLFFRLLCKVLHELYSDTQCCPS